MNCADGGYGEGVKKQQCVSLSLRNCRRDGGRVGAVATKWPLSQQVHLLQVVVYRWLVLGFERCGRCHAQIKRLLCRLASPVVHAVFFNAGEKHCHLHSAVGTAALWFLRWNPHIMQLEAFCRYPPHA